MTNNDENLSLDHTAGIAIALIVLMVITMMAVGPAELGAFMLGVWAQLAWVITNLWNDLLGFIPNF